MLSNIETTFYWWFPNSEQTLLPTMIHDHTSLPSKIDSSKPASPTRLSSPEATKVHLEVPMPKRSEQSQKQLQHSQPTGSGTIGILELVTEHLKQSPPPILRQSMPHAQASLLLQNHPSNPHLYTARQLKHAAVLYNLHNRTSSTTSFTSAAGVANEGMNSSQSLQ